MHFEKENTLLQEAYEMSAAMGLPFSLEDVQDVMYLQKDKGEDQNLLINTLLGGLHMETIRHRVKQARDRDSATTNTIPKNLVDKGIQSMNFSVKQTQIDTIYSVVQAFKTTDTNENYTRDDVIFLVSNYQGNLETLTNDIVTRMMVGMHTRALCAEPIPTVRTFECLLCYEEYPMDNTYSFDCKDAHRACIKCAVDHVRHSLENNQLATCIDGECKYTVSTFEIKQLEILISDPLIQGNDSSLAKLKKAGNDILLSDFNEELSLAGFFMQTKADCVGCPTPDCKGYQFMSNEDQCEKMTCNICNFTFGSLCKKLYHYKTNNCEEVVPISARYERWKTEQRK